jgi:nitroimidazol reductase NimA-like FMN-containing flavoprotein (pyridoxamine 5'-phosphate oxidase superfamily)
MLASKKRERCQASPLCLSAMTTPKPPGWNATQIAAFLHESRIPLRLAVQDQTGCPRVVSLWFMPEGEALWCATQSTAQVARYLREEPRCGFEVAGDLPPYRGVRGTGLATLHPERGEEMLRLLLARYGIAPTSKLAKMLLAKADSEVAIRIAPARVHTWDFSQRMQGAVAQ